MHRMNAGFEISEIAALLGGAYAVAKPQYTMTQQVLDLFVHAGWNRSFVQTHFAELHDSLLEGWNASQFTKEYTKYLALHTNEKTSLSKALSETGLHRSIAKAAERRCHPLLGSSYSFQQVLECAIEYVLGYFTPITPPTASFFLQPNRVDEWIPHESKQILNFPFACQWTALTILKRRLTEWFPQPGTKLFFHTTNWRSLRGLFKHIQHERGRFCLDFGYLPGFYMSETLEDCMEWGIKRADMWSNEIAILVFQLPTRPPDSLELQVLEDVQEWKHVVRESRNCNGDDDLVAKVDASDLVYGPMLANVLDYSTVGPKMHSPSKKQLVSKSRAGDVFLHQHLRGAVVFQKR